MSVLSWPAYRNRAWHRIAVACAAGLVLAACQQAARPAQQAEPRPEPEPPLSRDVATGLAGSMQVDDALAASLRSLGDPLGGLDLPPVPGPQGMELEEVNIDACAPMPDAGADSDADGYPAEPTTFALDCEILVVHLGGTLVLEDKDDMDPDSGFRSELALEISLNIQNENAAFGAVQYALDVDESESGAGYTVFQSGELTLLVPEEPFLEGKVRLAYAATLDGSFQSGTLTIAAGDGTFSFATVPIDCSMLDGREADECRKQTSQNAGISVPFAVAATEVAFDKESCATAITGGYFDVQDDPGNVLRISYDGCGERSATYNGELIQLPPPDMP